MFKPCRVKVCVAAAVLCLLAPAAARAQAEAQAPPPRELSVTVTDGQGGFVTGLRRESFTVLDGGRPSEIVSFAAGDMPATVGVLLDASASFVTARRELLRVALGRQDILPRDRRRDERNT